MRRLLAAMLLVLLCVPQLARAEAPLDEARIERLLNHLPVSSFTGAPDRETGWGAVEGLISETPKSDGKHYSMEALQNLYRGIFTEGRLSGKPEAGQFGGYLKKQGKGYQYIHEDVPGGFFTVIHSIEPQSDGTFVADYTCYDADDPEEPYSGSWFCGSARAKLMPDENALFGATVMAVRVTRSWDNEFSPASASSDVGEHPGASVDGDSNTCWSFDPDQTPNAELVIRFHPDTQVRGLVVLTGDASSPENYTANRRIKKLHVTLSDGSVREGEALDLPEYLYDDDRITLVFKDIQMGGELRLRFPESYAGSGANRVCVSEVRAF